ncbi:cytochrome P450 [Sistotremastrum suecicum HHB10207 ss-3]|uniref:Cytochrome P450 n=1 Tax=Sistotremastrum suecicum HHB10207 ss-3 TaxID=1314776 RepID=A0A165YRX1_9AGAM|nr:cytochrome P450 [Sistotremastrum suecicum HHB10207 ss-3]
MSLTSLAVTFWAILAVVAILRRIREVIRLKNSIKGIPVRVVLLSYRRTIANILYIPYICLGINYPWIHKFDDYERNGCTAHVIVSVTPCHATLYVADTEAIKEISTYRPKFPKRTETYRSMGLFGQNIVVSEGEEWKRQRKIAAPAFSEKNNKLVCTATVNIINELFQNIWGDKQEIIVEHGAHLTIPIALMVLSVAGFGNPMTWEADTTPPPGHKLTFAQCLHSVTNDVILNLTVPTWALGLTERLRTLRTANKELKEFILAVVEERRTKQKHDDRWDLLTNLIDASEADDNEYAKLSNSELVGNIFVYLVAGHETTAHGLCYTLGLLALHAEEQEKLHDHIKSVLGDRDPVYEDLNSLPRVLACFYESIRLFQPAIVIPRVAAQDTTFHVSSTKEDDDTTTAVTVPKGSDILAHSVGLHYNPKIWPEPEQFKPERFLGAWNRDAFFSFSSGPRACIGRKFGETEAVTVLAMLISRYKVEIKPEPQFANESFNERYNRIFKSNSMVTLT